MKPSNHLLLLILICSVSFGSNLRASDEQARHWLQRMNTSVSELDFDGHFVYLRGDMLDAMQIRHRVEEGNVREYLISLTGTAREVIRDNTSISIIQSRNGKVSISRRSTVEKLSPLSSLDPEELNGSYRLLMGEDVRMAGRAAKVILLQPKDNLRYGCRLVLDQSNALPLGVSLFDEDSKQVSRIMFTDLQVLYPADEDAELQTAMRNAQVRAGASESVAAATDVFPESPQAVDLPSITDWQFNALPIGYQLKNYHLRNKTEDTQRMEHFVFSDGLATVSVYVEPLTETGLKGEASLGAVNALGAELVGHQLTIVGEVPQATLKMLLSGAHLNAG